MAAPRAFDIDAQPLGSALNLFGRQAGLQVFYPSRAVSGRRAPRVVGTMEPRAALDRIIAATGLSVAGYDGRIVILQAAPVAARPPEAKPRLPRADSDAATPLEEVIITSGPRAGDLKRDADTVVSTITQLEIQRLPNLSLSDVLSRLPGVRRNETQSGENRYVQIRGLNNAAASQSIDGVLLTNYVNGSRATSTELLPANFIKAVTVTSTVTPDLDENANSAHVALKTISGLDGGGGRVADIRVLVGDNNRSGGVMGGRQPVRLSASWKGAIDPAGRFGLALSANLDRLGSRQDAVSTAGYGRVGGLLLPDGALTRGETYTRTQRASAMVRLDARPAPRLALFAEYFILRHEFSTEQRTATLVVRAGDASAVTEGAGQFGLGAPTYGFNSGHPRLTDHIVQLGGDYEMGGGDSLSFRLGATFNRVRSTSLANSGFTAGPHSLAAPVGYAFDHEHLSFTSGGDAGTADPANYRLNTKAVIGDVLSRDQNYFARLDYAHNAAAGDLGLGWKLGAQLKTLDRSNAQRGYARVLPADGILLSEVSDTQALTLFAPIDWDMGRFLDLLARRGTPSPDTNGLYAEDPADGYGQNFSGHERIEVGYGLVSYGWPRGRVSAGARAAHTRRRLDQYEPDSVGRYRMARYRQDYWHVLPSAYGAYDLTSDLKLRAAFTRTLERPAINTASRRLITSYDIPVTRSVSYSDPYLKPIRSTNFDASAEYYLGGGAFVSLGAFAKDLRDIPAVSSSQTTGPDGVREIVTYTSNLREVGGRKVYGRVRGLELSWSQPSLSVFPTAWGNLGLSLSYDHLVYRMTAVDGGVGVPASDTRLVDAAPRRFFNAALAYNRGPFAANLAVQSLSSMPMLSYVAANDRRTAHGPLVDLQASWQVRENLRVLVEARNLLDQDIADRYGATDYGPAHQIRNNGRTIWLGFQLTRF